MNCPKCHAPVIRGLLGADQVELLLDPHALTFASIEPLDIYPQDGDRIFATSAYVEHRVLCPVEQRPPRARPQRQQTPVPHATTTKGA